MLLEAWMRTVFFRTVKYGMIEFSANCGDDLESVILHV